MIDIRIPPRVIPPNRADRRLIDELMRLREASPLSTRQQAAGGVSLATTHEWRHGTLRPSLEAFERALNVIGYELKIVPAKVP